MSYLVVRMRVVSGQTVELSSVGLFFLTEFYFLIYLGLLRTPKTASTFFSQIPKVLVGQTTVNIQRSGDGLNYELTFYQEETISIQSEIKKK